MEQEKLNICKWSKNSGKPGGRKRNITKRTEMAQGKQKQEQVQPQ